MSSNTSVHQHFEPPAGQFKSSIIRRPSEKLSPSSVQLNMKCEADRLKTFQTWSVSFMDKNKLAAAGFFYLKVDDMVKCAFCSLEVGQWEKGDDPLKEHKRFFPRCPYLRGLPVGNIPLGGIPENRNSKDLLSCYDVCGPFTLQVRPNSTSEEKHNNLPLSLEKLGIQKAGTQHSQFATEHSRIRSFKTWPISLKTRPESLCEAGFFYTGEGDKTCCFQCGTALRNWQDTDDPWVEHAKWSPKCPYVIQMKGVTFINDINKKNELIMNSQDVQNIELPENLKNTVKIRKQRATPSCVSEVEKKTISAPNPGGLTDMHMCKICFNEEIGIVFLPCGHTVACVKCAAGLDKCVICRQPLNATVRAFLS